MAGVELLILNRNVEEGPTTGTRFGGAPSVGRDFSWPVCKFCHGNMQFLGQLRREGSQRLHLVFMCQNRPGVCWEWDADKGGNAVVCSEITDLRLADVPPEGEAVRPTLYGARVESVEASSYDKARSAWAEKHPGRQREVLGQINGQPDWLQFDETPSCDHCGQPMNFVAQLEQGPDYETEMNFASGCGYVFDCGCNGGVGKFLWQG